MRPRSLASCVAVAALWASSSCVRERDERGPAPSIASARAAARPSGAATGKSAAAPRRAAASRDEKPRAPAPGGESSRAAAPASAAQAAVQDGGSSRGDAAGATGSSDAGAGNAAADADLPARVGDMILVPAGPFTMGADDLGEQDERPAHLVTLPAFYLDATEVTNEAYARCVEAKVCKPPDPRSADANHFGPDKRFRSPRQPVSSITWFDAQAYCAWAGKRLPTEAELEKAARGVDGRRYPWGNEPPTREHAVFESSVTEEVGTHPKGDGPYGHHDLAGNVWEWAADVYDPFAYRRDDAATGGGATCERALAVFDTLRRRKQEGFTGSNPIPTECERVLRGGGFNYPGRGLRASNRVHHPPRYHLVMSGFRCAKDARPSG